MTGADARGSLGGLFGSVGELLKNKAVIEALVAGVSAFSASKKIKSKGEAVGAGGLDLSGLIDMLPRVLPLIGMLSGADGGLFGTSASASDSAAALPVFADDAEEASSAELVPMADSAPEPVPNALEALSFGAELGGAATESRVTDRENLLRALRPFLSESRAAAADAMIQVNRISGLFG